jgi:methyl-accepting chemotaxis protein
MEQQITALIIKNVSSAAVFIAVAIMGSFLFANTLASPIKRLTTATRDISLGNNLLEPIHDIERKDEVGELARSVDRLKTSVRIMMGRIVKK